MDYRRIASKIAKDEHRKVALEAPPPPPPPDVSIAYHQQSSKELGDMLTQEMANVPELGKYIKYRVYAPHLVREFSLGEYLMGEGKDDISIGYFIQQALQEAIGNVEVDDEGNTKKLLEWAFLSGKAKGGASKRLSDAIQKWGIGSDPEGMAQQRYLEKTTQEVIKDATKLFIEKLEETGNLRSPTG